MIKEGDRVLLGVSGGKESLTLFHTLEGIRKSSPVHWELGCCTVDPQTPAFDPSPLKQYFESLGVPFFYESQAIIDRASTAMTNPQLQGRAAKKISICSFCSRMKRGVLYNCCRREGYNVLALGHHLDDFAESFVMSAFMNGSNQTMKANYTIDEGDLRVIRPLALCRERAMREYADMSELPVIEDNCPRHASLPLNRGNT